MGTVEQSSAQHPTENALNLPMGAVVRAWREARELPITRLAQLAGPPVTKDYVSKLEHGKIQQAGRLHRGKIAKALGIQEEDLVLRRMPPENASPHPAIESSQSELGVRLAGLDPTAPLRDWQSPSDLLKPVMDPCGYWEVFDLENLTRATFGRDERTILEILTHKPPQAAMGRTLVGELLHRILWSYLPLEARMHLGAAITHHNMAELIDAGLLTFEVLPRSIHPDAIGEDITRRLAMAEEKILKRWKDSGLL